MTERVNGCRHVDGGCDVGRKSFAGFKPGDFCHEPTPCPYHADHPDPSGREATWAGADKETPRD
jgi:hypothetical protein